MDDQPQTDQPQQPSKRKPLVDTAWPDGSTPVSYHVLGVLGWRYTTEQVNTGKLLPDGNQVLRTVEVTTVLAELDGKPIERSVKRWSGDPNNRIVARRRALLRLVEELRAPHIGMTKKAVRYLFKALRQRGVRC